jgi:hypothetical protein
MRLHLAPQVDAATAIAEARASSVAHQLRKATF